MTIEVTDKNGKEVAWRFWVQIVLGFLQIIVMCIIIPWGAWVTTKIYAHEQQQARIQAWIDQGQRLTVTDADNLRMKIMNEISEKINSQLLPIYTKLESLQVSTLKIEMAVNQHSEILKQKN